LSVVATKAFVLPPFLFASTLASMRDVRKHGGCSTVEGAGWVEKRKERLLGMGAPEATERQEGTSFVAVQYHLRPCESLTRPFRLRKAAKAYSSFLDDIDGRDVWLAYNDTAAEES
jgi:hypothetical protein